MSLINRQDAIDICKSRCEACGKYKKYNGVMCGSCYLDGVADDIECLPSVQKTQLSSGGTTSDLIDRWNAIDACECDANILDAMDSVEDGEMHRTKRAIVRILAGLPSAQKLASNLHQTIKNDATDLISRQDAIDLVESLETQWLKGQIDSLYAPMVKGLMNLPSAQITGTWRHYEGMLTCSECGAEFYDDIMEYCGDDVPKYCPDCGCCMKGEEDGKVN